MISLKAHGPTLEPIGWWRRKPDSALADVSAEMLNMGLEGILYARGEG